MVRWAGWVRWSLVCCLLCAGAVALAAFPVTHTLTVDGEKRTALVYAPAAARKSPAPVVFVFHGFGGDARGIAGTSIIHVVWPEAIVVYPQGLLVWSKRQEKMVPAWQPAPGSNGDRDVRFVDALLTRLEAQYKVDERRIYAAGSSNGAMFAFVLLAMRPERFAAIAGVAGGIDFLPQLTTPRPVLMIHGSADEEVPIARAEALRDRMIAVDGCGPITTEWRPGCQQYTPGPTGCSVYWRVHDGGHIWPDGAARMIVPFFKEQLLPEVKPQP